MPTPRFFVYSMGRIGSVSYRRALSNQFKKPILDAHIITKHKVSDQNTRKLYKYHSYNWPFQHTGRPPYYLTASYDNRSKRGSQYIMDALKSKQECAVITGVRDPIAHSLCRFFFNISRGNATSILKYLKIENKNNFSEWISV